MSYSFVTSCLISINALPSPKGFCPSLSAMLSESFPAMLSSSVSPSTGLIRVSTIHSKGCLATRLSRSSGIRMAIRFCWKSWRSWRGLSYGTGCTASWSDRSLPGSTMTGGECAWAAGVGLKSAETSTFRSPGTGKRGKQSKVYSDAEMLQYLI